MKKFVMRCAERTAKRCGCSGTAGFTLVELVVSMLCASIIMGAVMTWLLVGIRVETSAADTMERQQKTRVLLTMMESMASSGKIASVQETGATVDEGGEASDGASDKAGAAGVDWALLDHSGKALVRYRAGSGSIVTGGGDVLMDGLEFASAKFDQKDDMLELSLRADGREYSSNIFCRTAVEPLNYGSADLLGIIQRNGKTQANRFAFVTLLTSQEGSNGKIIDPSEVNGSEGRYKYDYYTQCYLANTAGADGGTVDNWSLEGSGVGMNWSPKTPWCGTFVSWALLHMNHECYRDDSVTLAYVPLFADVNDGRALFHEDYVLGSGFGSVDGAYVGGYNTAVVNPDTGEYGWYSGTIGNGQLVKGKDSPSQKVGKWISASVAQEEPEAVATGDLIFFDWGDVGSSSGAVESGDGSLDHVGVVLYVEGDQVFTIEGNTDGKVALRNYSLSDPAIVGYGLLDWAGDTNET